MEKIQIRIQQIWICVLDISFLSCGALGKLANLSEPWFIHIVSENWGFPSGSVVKNHPANAGDAEDANLIPGFGRCPGEGDGNHSSILVWENHRGAWWATVHGGPKESDTTEHTHTHTHTHTSNNQHIYT